MRNSPFAIFRKHQKALMVAVTLMAMFAFVFLDAMQRGSRNRSEAATEAAVETNAGNLSRQELSQLVSQRQAANRFVERVFITTHPELAQMGAMFLQQQLQRLMFSFGRPVQQDVLLGHLLRLEARQNGIIVTDAQIENYIERISETKLTTSQFKKIISDLKMGSKQTFDILRDELQAMLAFRMEMPSNPLPPEQYWRYYKQLQVKQQLEVAAIPIRTKADADGKMPPSFLDKVADPGDEALEKMFDEHKTTFEQVTDDEKAWQPGFRQPRRTRLHYITLDYKSVEEAIAKNDPVTDEQVAEYYEKNKEAQYRVSTIPSIDEKKDDTKPLDPEFTPEKNGKEKPADGDAKKTDDKKPADDKKPDEEKKDGEEKKTEGKKDGDDKPAEKKDEKKVGWVEERDPPASSVTVSGGSRSSTHPTLAATLLSGESLALLLADDDKPAADAEKKPADSKDDKPAESKPAAEKKADEKKSDPADRAAKKAADENKPAPATEKKPDDETPPPPPTPKYRELDDDLKQEIRDRLLKERTLAALKKKGEAVTASLRDESLKLLTTNSLVDVTEDRLPDVAQDTTSQDKKRTLPELKAEQKKQLGAIAETSADKLKELATKHGGQFGDSGLVSATELGEIKGLGDATEPTDNPFQPGADIVEQSFQSRSLCSPEMAASPVTNDLIVHWKVRDDADYVASFKDSDSGKVNSAIRKQVLDAWRFQQAQPLAQKRADALADLAKKGEPTKSLKELLTDQTVTGDEDSPALAVNETPAFSWLRESSAQMSNPFASRPPPQMSSPAFIDRPGTAFMETVFDKLKPGDIGVVANVDHSVYYVVKVTIRNEPDHTAFMKANLFGGSMGFFFATPYDQLASREQQQANFQWAQGLEKKYAVKWSDQVRVGEQMDLDD